MNTVESGISAQLGTREEGTFRDGDTIEDGVDRVMDAAVGVSPAAGPDACVVHERALELFVIPGRNWKTKRRRQRSLLACATDLAQRLHRASCELQDKLHHHFSSSSSSLQSSGLTVPLHALIWIRILLDEEDDEDEYDQNAASILRRHYYSNRASSGNDWNQIRLFLQQHVSHIRITDAPWPVSSTHRDRSVPPFSSQDFAAKWLHAYTQTWQKQTAPAAGPSLQLLTPQILPRLTVLWFHQLPTSLNVSNLASQLQVLRWEHTTLESWNNNINSDPFQQQPSNSTTTTKTTTTTTTTLYPHLTHLKITHCLLPQNNNNNHEQSIWRHFPALESLSLSHNHFADNDRDDTWMVGLSLLTKLQRLDLSHNNSNTTTVPHNLTSIHLHVGHLVELNVSYFGLTLCEGLDHLYSLERLYLDHNALQTLASIRGLVRLPQLQCLTLHDNPLATATTYILAKQKQHNHHHQQQQHNNNKHRKTTKMSMPNQSSLSSYRVSVLSLFWQARQTHDHNHPSQWELPLLDHQPITPDELRAIVRMSFAIQLPAPEYCLQRNNNDSNNKNDNKTTTTASSANKTTSKEQPLWESTAAAPYSSNRRPRSKSRFAIVEGSPSSRGTTKLGRHQAKLRQPLNTIPITKFNAADVLRSMDPLVLPPPPFVPEMVRNDQALEKEKKHESSEKSKPNNTETSISHDADPANPNEPNQEEKEKIPKETKKMDADHNIAEPPAAVPGKNSSIPKGSTAENSEKSATPPASAAAAAAMKGVVEDPPTSSTTSEPRKGQTLDKPIESSAPSATATMVQEQDRIIMAKLREQSEHQEAEMMEFQQRLLPLSPIRQKDDDISEPRQPRKMATIVLHNDTHSPFKQNAELNTSGGGSTSCSVASSRLPSDEMSETSALHSAMMLSFAMTTGEPWRRARSGDECSVVSSGTTSQWSDDRKKYLLAERNSTFVGPHMYKQITIHDNLEIYFRLFVFSTSTGFGLSNPLFMDPEELVWQSVLENYPRIQLWPVDRRLQDMDAACNMGPTGASVHEEFRRVWRERVVGCGEPSLKRLTPSRVPRRGFHGDVIWPVLSPSTTTAVTSATPLGQPEAVTRERHVILCCSTVAFYIIVDHDAVSAAQSANGTTTKQPKSFPRPVPTDACFAEALWPHALARHPWTDLRAITIGFNFQRLTLRFQSREGATRETSSSSSSSSQLGTREDEFCYVLLTSNKLETISILKELQDLTDNIAAELDTSAASLGTHVAIENDDPVVLDGLADVVENKVLGVVCHFQILRQYWKKKDRGEVRRLCVVTDRQIYLLDEDYFGDGSDLKEAASSSSKKARIAWGQPKYRIVDQAQLCQIAAVQAAAYDPCRLSISIRPSSRLLRTHNWRLICRDREGAERLIDDVRKAAAGM